MKQLPLRLAAGPAPSFDNFIVGANAAALDALRAPASGSDSHKVTGEGASAGAAPIYLWGPAGAGKSHLLAARAHGIAALRCDAARPAPWSWRDDAALLVLDDCGAYDAAQQHAAFTLFVEATAAGVPVIAAGRLPPVDLPVRDDLRTRLGWGPVFQLQPASEADARGALQHAARARGLRLPDDVLDFLLHHFARDLGSLMGWLDALDAYSLSKKRVLNLALLKRMLAEAEAGPRAGSDDPTAA